MTQFVGETLKLLEVGDLHPDDRLSALAVLLPRRIGAGVFRDVFEVAGRADVVVKIERRGLQFCNVAEWQVWERVQYTDLARWFAPCENISHDGRALVMRRTKPMPERVWRKLEVPAFFTDLKPENWGILDGRAVCHDYASHLLMERGMGGRKLRKAADD